MAKSKKIRVQTLLYNRKFLVCFSLVMSIMIWVAITLNESPIVERTVKDVKVKINVSVPKQLGYELYGNKEFTVDVKVSGKRYLVGDNVLKPEDIEVEALTSRVDKVGRYSLPLRVTPKNPDAGFTIVSTSLDFVEVYFDIPKTVEMTITPKITVKDKLVFSDDYISDTEVLSTTKATISGPATEVNKIKEVQAKLEITKPLKATQNFPADLVMLDELGQNLQDNLEVETGKSITITIPVYKKAYMNASVDFTNTPKDYQKNSLGIKANPTRINIAAPENAIEGLSSISVGKIDFSQISNTKNLFTFYKEDINNFKVLDDLEKIQIEVDASQMDKQIKAVKSSNINFINYEPGFVVKHQYSRLSNLTVIGPKSELDNLNTDNISVDIDLTNIDLKEGKQLVKVPLILKNDKCWIYGTYNVNLKNEID